MNEGGLYTWAEANGLADFCSITSCNLPTISQGICPNGWHVPSDAEFYALENYLTTLGQTCDPQRAGWGCSGAGAKMTSGGSSGFGAIGAGNHETNGSLSFLINESPPYIFGHLHLVLNVLIMATPILVL